MKKRPNGYWTEERIRKIALKCKSRQEFLRKYAGAYDAANKLNIYPEVCSHLPRKNELYWTEELILLEAKKYPTKFEFQKNCRGAYSRAKETNILNKVYAHMKIRPGDLCKRLTKQQIIKEVSKYKTKKEFKDANPALVHRCMKDKIYEEVCRHMPKNSHIKYSVENVLPKAKLCQTKREFKLKYPKEYNSMYRQGWLNQIFSQVEFKKEDVSSSMGEETSRNYINRLLGINLKKARVPWLKGKLHRRL